jgi:hypothetical protein
MAGKSAAPLLLLAGGAALLLGGKKKKKKSTSTDTWPSYDDLPSGDGLDPYIPPTPPSKPTTPSSRPPGNPPRGDGYDADYWGSTTEERLTKIRQFLKDFGYPVEVGPWPMNKLGPKGDFEMENEDGTMGKLGGGDDEPNATIRQFQSDYNRVSRLNKAEKLYAQSMGGLDKDGRMGPYTLNALRYAHDDKPGNKAWPDMIQMAELKGIS